MRQPQRPPRLRTSHCTSSSCPNRSTGLSFYPMLGCGTIVCLGTCRRRPVREAIRKCICVLKRQSESGGEAAFAYWPGVRFRCRLSCCQMLKIGCHVMGSMAHDGVGRRLAGQKVASNRRLLDRWAGCSPRFIGVEVQACSGPARDRSEEIGKYLKSSSGSCRNTLPFIGASMVIVPNSFRILRIRLSRRRQSFRHSVRALPKVGTPPSVFEKPRVKVRH